MTTIDVLYVVYNGHDTDSAEIKILLTTEYKDKALAHAKRHNAVVYRYDVTDNEEYINLYFPLNFRGQIASEAGSKPPVTRFVRLSTCCEAPQKV